MSSGITEFDSMAFTGEVPWHGQGNRVMPEATIDEWREQSGLTWKVRKKPLTFATRDREGGVTRHKTDRFALYRSDTKDSFNVVSERYKPVQPGDVFEFFREVVDNVGGFRMATIGSLRGGRKVWGLATSVEKPTKLGKDEQIRRHLLMATAFDGSLPTMIDQTSVRVVCDNTLTCAVNNNSNARRRWTHLQAFDPSRVVEDLSLDEGWKHFLGTTETLASIEVGKATALELARELYYPKQVATIDLDKSMARTIDRRMAEFEQVLLHAPGQQTGMAKGTGWGYVNAVTYLADHKQTTRPGARLDRVFFGDLNRKKRAAVEQVLAVG